MTWQATILHTSGPDFTQWKSYYDRLEQKGVYHSPEYIKFMGKYHQYEAELFIYGDEDNFVYYPYFKRRLDDLPFANKSNIELSKYYDIKSSWYYGGPICSIVSQQEHLARSLSRSYFNCFADYCQSSQIISEFIRFDPNLKNYLFVFNKYPLKVNRETVYVDLSLSEENLWEQYVCRCRTAIRKGRKFPVNVKRLQPEEFLNVFPDIYHQEMVRKKAPSHYFFSKVFFKDLINSLQEKAVLFVVTYEQKIVGGTISLFEEGGVAYDYLTATLPEYWKYQVNNMLFHEVILWCKKSGALIYDFHGGRSGVAFFKESFSPLRGSFYIAEITYNKQLYEKLVLLRKELEGDMPNGYFPEYRTKDTN